MVVLEFTAFNTASSFDKLTIRDSDGTILMEERSGNDLPSKIVSRTNVVHLHFYTDSRDTRTGWSANWVGVGIVCKHSEKHVIEGDERICDGKRDCVNGVDEENCGMFHINTECTESDCDVKFESRHFNLTLNERNGPRKGAFRDKGLVCEDKNGKWIFVGIRDPEMCDDLSQCKSGLDEANCTDLLGKVPIYIALGILAVSLLAYMLREVRYRYVGGGTEDFAKQFSREMRTPLDEAVDTIIEAAQTEARERDGSTEDFVKRFSQEIRTSLDTIIETAQIKASERDGSTEPEHSNKRIDIDRL